MAPTRSFVWDYFNRVGRRGGTCKACNASYVNGDVGRMQSHLLGCSKLNDRQKSQIKYRIDKTKDARSNSNQPSSFNPPDSSSSRSASGADITRYVQSFPSDKLSACHRELTLALITGNISFRFLENEHFIEFVRLLAPSYKVPDRYHGMTQTFVPREYERIREIVDKAIADASFFSFSTDGWSDVNRRFFMNLLIHTPEPWLHTFEEVTDESETGEKVYEFVKSVMEEVGADRVAGLVTDHAPTMVKAWRLLKIDYPWLQTVGCKAHALNLFIKDLAEHTFFETFILTCTSLVSFFNTKLNATILHDSFKQANMPRLKFVKPVSTRWNSYYNAAKRIVQIRTVIEAALYSPKLNGADVRSLRLRCGEAFWKKADNFLKLIGPIAEMTVVVQSNNASIDTFTRVEATLQATKAAVDDIDFSDAIRTFVKRCVDERLEFMKTDLPFLHALLNPYSRGSDLSDIQRNRARHLLRTEISQNPRFGAAAVQELQEWEARIGRWKPIAVGPESEAWQALEDGKLDSVSWWRVYFPNTKLGLLMVFMTSIPVSSAASERTWSIRGAIQTKTRNRLLVNTADQLAFVKYNLLLLKARSKPTITGNLFAGNAENEVETNPAPSNDNNEVEIIELDSDNDDVTSVVDFNAMSGEDEE